AGVADPELDVVEPVEGQEVLGLLVGVLVDDGAALVRRAAGDGLGHRAAPVLCADAPAPLRRCWRLSSPVPVQSAMDGRLQVLQSGAPALERWLGAGTGEHGFCARQRSP